MLQILRYTETPVGPYDELLLIPGYFDTPVGGGKKGLRNNRITAIWVSQKDTCWNGMGVFLLKKILRWKDSWG